MCGFYKGFLHLLTVACSTGTPTRTKGSSEPENDLHMVSFCPESHPSCIGYNCWTSGRKGEFGRLPAVGCQDPGHQAQRIHTSVHEVRISRILEWFGLRAGPLGR